MSNFTDYENDEDDNSYKSDLDKWNESDSQSAGYCPTCGSKIRQSTYSDYCMCGDSDQAY